MWVPINETFNKQYPLFDGTGERATSIDLLSTPSTFVMRHGRTAFNAMAVGLFPGSRMYHVRTLQNPGEMQVKHTLVVCRYCAEYFRSSGRFRPGHGKRRQMQKALNPIDDYIRSSDNQAQER